MPVCDASVRSPCSRSAANEFKKRCASSDVHTVISLCSPFGARTELAERLDSRSSGVGPEFDSPSGFHETFVERVFRRNAASQRPIEPISPVIRGGRQANAPLKSTTTSVPRKV
jgi:hypothetical protein